MHVYQPEKIKSDSAFDFFTRVAPDAVVIIAYGQIVPARLIAIPRLGWINLHASLLPKYRGAAPIAWAIANGETLTGLTTMQIDAGMDTGPMLLRHEMAIGPDETAPELARAWPRRERRWSPNRCVNSTAARSGPSRRTPRKRAMRPCSKRSTADRLVASGTANLQPDARLGSVARRLHQIPRANLPDLGTAG